MFATVRIASIKLDREATRITALVSASIGSHQTFARSLGKAQNQIATISSADELRVVVAMLVSENQRMRREAEAMAAQLNDSRTQIASLNVSLEQARKEGLSDALTSVGNRRAFDTVLEDAVKAALSAKSPLSIVMADIDSFKTINDQYGHTVGDGVLKIFSNLLTESARQHDTVTRVGGEEFAIIMPNTPGLSAGVVAERMRSRIETQQLKVGAGGEHVVRITSSFGVAELEEGDTVEALMQRVDARLYKAKSQGRNRVVTI